MTETIPVDATHPQVERIARAARVLRKGGLVAFPTETVYGLGAHALDAAAVARVFAAKGRPSTDPLIVHVASLDAARPLVAAIPDAAVQLAARFWPGPLTIVLPRSDRVPDSVTAGLETVAVRVPAHPVARALIEAAAVPVAAPSANLFSRPSPTTAAHVLEDLDGRIDLVIDAGPTTVGVESTVLDLAHGAPAILRPGAVTVEMLREVLPDVQLASPSIARVSDAMPSPGLLEKHYSPKAPLTLYEGADAPLLIRLAADTREHRRMGRHVGLLAAHEDLAHLPADDAGTQVVDLGSLTDPATIAARLYAGLRTLDASGVDVILAREFPGEANLGDAIRDRLRRAAGRIVHVTT